MEVRLIIGNMTDSKLKTSLNSKISTIIKKGVQMLKIGPNYKEIGPNSLANEIT